MYIIFYTYYCMYVLLLFVISSVHSDYNMNSSVGVNFCIINTASVQNMFNLFIYLCRLYNEIRLPLRKMPCWIVPQQN